MKILIVGGVALGASALARLSRLNRHDELIMFEKDEYVSFANCGLPYYLGHVIKKRDSLIVMSKEALMARTGADIRVFHEVIHIDPINKEVVVYDINNDKKYFERYDKLILGPGARPFVPKLEGADKAENIFTLRNIADVDAIESFLSKPNVKDIVIVGSGFIGCEMAENLKERGLNVQMVELSSQILAPFDSEMAKLLANELTGKGIHIHLNTSINAVLKDGKEVQLTNGKILKSDMILMSIGVVPETALAKMANLEIGVTGGIVVNEFMQTSNPDIYAGGDAVEVKHYVSHLPVRIPLAWPANRQGRLIADHIHEKASPYLGSQGTSVVKMFDKVGASTGLNEKQVKQMGYQYRVVHIIRGNHASYYPNSEDMMIKLIFDSQSLKVLGAQAIGGEGTEKRIDVLSTAIHFNANIYDLQALELSYAPPFSSAKDPVNIAGYVAENIQEAMVEQFFVQDIEDLLKQKAQLVDVRTEKEYADGHIEGAINIPVDDMDKRLKEVDFNQPVYLICRVGLRGYVASTILKQSGFKQPIYNLSGGYLLYQSFIA